MGRGEESDEGAFIAIFADHASGPPGQRADRLPSDSGLFARDYTTAADFVMSTCLNIGDVPGFARAILILLALADALSKQLAPSSHDGSNGRMPKGH